MKIKFPLFLHALCFGALMIICGLSAHAQRAVQSLNPDSNKEVSGFTTVIDSKIERSDTEMISNFIAQSDHAPFLEKSLSPIIYILDLDHFKDGMAPFSVFGKEVKVISKSEVLDLNVPFYLTIDGYNKQQNTTSGKVTLHSTGKTPLSGDSKMTILNNN